MINALITGFGPFPGVTDNPSATAARALDGQEIAGFRVVGRVLPVTWRGAWPTLQAEVDQHRPDALLMLGVAPREAVELERYGRNAVADRPDADGERPPDEWAGRILPQGPDRLPAALPPATFDNAHGRPPLRASDDAGEYLCNYVLYRALAELPHVRWRAFIHLPPGEPTEAINAITHLLTDLAESREAPPGV